jgi:hypothetical protein
LFGGALELFQEMLLISFQEMFDVSSLEDFDLA